MNKIEDLYMEDLYLKMDNENQDFVWISPKVGEMLKPYSNLLHTYYQPDHTNLVS